MPSHKLLSPKHTLERQMITQHYRLIRIFVRVERRSIIEIIVRLWSLPSCRRHHHRTPSSHLGPGTGKQHSLEQCTQVLHLHISTNDRYKLLLVLRRNRLVLFLSLTSSKSINSLEFCSCLESRYRVLARLRLSSDCSGMSSRMETVDVSRRTPWEHV